uniref:Swi5-dependent recombination DNA repair protein 1 homolog n=1 Tax=Eptatretus burgeri TaxID=7764 RepID=A0A8C4Q0W0_EPTBU
MEESTTPRRIPTPMSASLRERLKRSRRSFNASPHSCAKQPKLQEKDGLPDSSPELQPACSSGMSMNPGSPAFTPRAKSPGFSSDEHPLDVVGTPISGPASQVAPSSQKSTSSRSVQVKFKAEGLGVTCNEEMMLVQKIQAREETLRRLHMVKRYRTKNNLLELQQLIHRWRQAAQSLLYDLQKGMIIETSHKPSLSELMAGMGIDPALLHYNAMEDAFD